MEPEDPPSAHQELLEAQSRLRRLKRSLGPAASLRQVRSWKQLRRSLETLRDLMGAWTAMGDAPEGPGRLRRRNELEARALRVESALREVEERQGALDGDRERTLAELERIQEGWRLLREETPVPPLEDSTLGALRAKIADVTTGWERSLAAHAEEERERQAIDRIWRWIVTVSLPTLEKRATGSDRSVLLPTVRRLLEDLDRRWRVSFALPAAATPSDALAAAQDLIAAREGRIAVLAKELEFLKGSLEEARGQVDRWQGLCGQARDDARALERELENRQQAFTDADRRRQAAERGLAQAELELARAAERLEQSRLRREDERRWQEAQKERQRLSTLLEEARRELETRERALEAGRQEHEKLLVVFDESQKQVAALERRAAGLEQELIEHKAPLEREKARLRGDVEILQKALDGSRQAFDEASARAQRLQEELLAAKADLSTLDQAHLVLSRKAEDVENERKRQAERERVLQAQEVELRDRAAEADGRSAALEEQAARLKADFDQESARLTAEIEALRARDRELMEEAAALRRQAAQALGLAQARRGEAEKARAEAKEAQELAAAARAQAVAAREEEARIRAAAADTSRRLQLALARVQASIDSTESAAAAVAKAAAEEEARKAKEDAARKDEEPAPDWPKILARLREPVAAAYLGLRKAAAQLPEGQRSLLRPASAPLLETNDLLRLLCDYLSEAEAKPVPVKPAALLQTLAAWRPALRKRKIVVKRAAAREVPAALVDPAGLRLVLNQVLRNAYDAMAAGGTLEVRLSHDNAAQHVVLTITDSGKGFSKEYLESPLRPFVTDKKGRLGLGLALARKTVRKWGGDALAANVKGAGAQIVLRLPAGSAAPEAPGETNAPVKPKPTA